MKRFTLALKKESWSAQEMLNSQIRNWTSATINVMQHNETLCPTTSLRNIKEILSVGVFIGAWIKLTLKGIKLAVGDCYGYNALDVFKKLKNNKK